MIAQVMSEASREILRPVVAAAARDYGTHNGVLFGTHVFGVALTQAFDLKRCPDWTWTNDVLSQLPYVTPLAQLGFWKYEPTN